MFPPYRFVLRSFHVNPCSFLGTNKKTAKQNENNKKEKERRREDKSDTGTELRDHCLKYSVK